MKKNIEVEARAFISEEKYHKLMHFFKHNSTHVDEDIQTTFYLRNASSMGKDEKDLRIMKTQRYSKIWFKKGKLHDEHREEIEIKVRIEDFEKMYELFEILGYYPAIKWFRNRNTFDWEGIKVDLDYTKGYGYIIELEFMAEDDKEEKERVYQLLLKKLSILGVEKTPREVFEGRYNYYKENWKNLI
jgi:adenylate cyclase, class 2